MTATCVIYNPAAGRGKTRRAMRQWMSGQGDRFTIRQTTVPGEAVAMAEQAVRDGFCRVIAAGGDGTVHEVANGLIRSGSPDVILGVWPLGSSNDYAYTTGMAWHWERRGERLTTEVLAVDVGLVQGGGRERYTINSLGVGFNGMVTVESRKIRGLRGLPLYALAFVKTIARHFRAPEMRVRLDDTEYTGPTLALTVNIAQREGGFPITPNASLTDGLADYMLATDLRRWQLLRYLPAMAMGRLPENHPRIRLGRARWVEVDSTEPVCVHADGEFFCRPEEGIRELTVEVLPKRIKVEVCRRAMYGFRDSPA